MCEDYRDCISEMSLLTKWENDEASGKKLGVQGWVCSIISISWSELFYYTSHEQSVLEAFVRPPQEDQRKLWIIVNVMHDGLFVYKNVIIFIASWTECGGASEFHLQFCSCLVGLANLGTQGNAYLWILLQLIGKSYYKHLNTKLYMICQHSTSLIFRVVQGGDILSIFQK